MIPVKNGYKVSNRKEFVEFFSYKSYLDVEKNCCCGMRLNTNIQNNDYFFQKD